MTLCSIANMYVAVTEQSEGRSLSSTFCHNIEKTSYRGQNQQSTMHLSALFQFVFATDCSIRVY